MMMIMVIIAIFYRTIVPARLHQFIMKVKSLFLMARQSMEVLGKTFG